MIITTIMIMIMIMIVIMIMVMTMCIYADPGADAVSDLDARHFCLQSRGPIWEPKLIRKYSMYIYIYIYIYTRIARWALVGPLGSCGPPWALVGRALIPPLGYKYRY